MIVAGKAMRYDVSSGRAFQIDRVVGVVLRKQTAGSRLRIDVSRRRVDVQIDADETGHRRDSLRAAGGYHYPESQTPWQAIQRGLVGQLGDGATLERAERSQRIDRTQGLPRDSQ